MTDQPGPVPSTPSTPSTKRGHTPGVDLKEARAADFEESPQVKISRLERALADERKHSVKVTRQLHRHLAREVREAEKAAAAAERRAVAAERRATDAQRRARQAEAELATMRQSTTWRAGRAVVALPARVRRQFKK